MHWLFTDNVNLFFHFLRDSVVKAFPGLDL